jgi:hypothetical protein
MSLYVRHLWFQLFRSAGSKAQCVLSCLSGPARSPRSFRKLVFMSFRLLAQELEWQEHELQEIVCAPSRFAGALAGRDGSPVVTEDAV